MKSTTLDASRHDSLIHTSVYVCVAACRGYTINGPPSRGSHTLWCTSSACTACSPWHSCKRYVHTCKCVCSSLFVAPAFVCLRALHVQPAPPATLGTHTEGVFFAKDTIDWQTALELRLVHGLRFLSEGGILGTVSPYRCTAKWPFH